MEVNREIQGRIKSDVERNCVLDFELKMIKLMSEDGEFFESLYRIIDGNKLTEPVCRRAYCMLRDVYERNGQPMSGGIPSLREKMVIFDKLEGKDHLSYEAEYTLEFLNYMESLEMTPKQEFEVKRDAKYLHAYTYLLEARALFNEAATKRIGDVDWNYWKRALVDYLETAEKMRSVYEELISLEKPSTVYEDRKPKDDWK